MTNSIVTVNVSTQTPPAPSFLQRTGAFISQGGTTTTAQTLTLLTQLSDLTNILAGSKALTSLTWSGGVVTGTTTAAHGWTSGDVISVVIAGTSPTAYSGTVTATITGTTTFTYPLVTNPGTSPATTPGTVTLGAVSELLAMATTFFAQGSANSVYVLELGEGTPTENVPNLTTWITANPNTIYAYLVPKGWDANSTFLTFLGNYENTTSKTYFHVTTTSATYTSYTLQMKCVLATVQAPLAPSTEFTAAAQFWVTLNYNPGSTNKVPPLAFSFVYGVTPYPLSGNSTLLTALKTANIGYIGTGAEGGLSNTILFWGHTLDGHPFNYWYSIDWAQINIQLALANAVINGSNSTINPLIYNQQGINVLQDVATQTVGNAITYGLAIGSISQTQLPITTFIQNFDDGDYLNQCVVNAEPFLTYTAENPSDYSIGKYAGLACSYIPARGFEAIVFNLQATSFV